MERSAFSERLAEVLEERKMRQTDLCRLTGINKATISQYLSGKYTAKHDRAVVLAQALGCNPLWLEGYDVDMEAGVGDDNTEIMETGCMLPVVELTLDQNGKLVRDNVVGREYVPREWRDSTHFYIRMPDTAMTPLICKGDLVLCELCDRLENEEVGLFVVNGREIWIKKYFRRRNGMALVSEDKRWSEQFYLDSGTDTVSVEARVIQCTHRF